MLHDGELLGALQVPQDHGAAPVAGERAAVVDGQRGGSPLVELDGAHQRAGAGVPDLERAVGAGRDDPAPLIGHADRVDGTGVTGEAGRLGEVGGLARHQVGAAALDLRNLVLIGDGQ